MRIVTVQHAIPSQEISNEWVIGKLREHNQARLTVDELDLLERRVSHFLESAGTRVRYGLARGEKAIDFALDAGRRAMAVAGLSARDVDFVIWVGVGRGWTEPAMANVVQWQLGLEHATCFDVIDACASWLRALHIAHTYIRSGVYRCGMIVNCECGFVTYRDWELDSLDDLEHRAAGWTVGEAATATIVDDEDPDDDAYFVFRNFGKEFRLCVFPLPMLEDFWVGPPDPRYRPIRLFSLSGQLVTATARRLVETYLADSKLRDGEYDIGFGHEASVKINRMIAAKLHLPYERYVSTHAEYGNTVSATVPLGMSVALADGRLQRGKRVLVLMGASGITVGLATFTF